MGSLVMIVLMLIQVAVTLIVVHVVMSLLIAFNVLNRYQPVVAQVWQGLNGILDPAYRPIRRLLPPTGGIDFAPLVALLVLSALQIVLRNNFLS
jgi:YggT family protein